MKIKLKVLLSFALLSLSVQAQFIDIGEPVPFGCPSVCAGNTILFKIFHVQNLPSGSTVQALLSNASGSFTSGTTLINSNKFSTISASGPWTIGSYSFSGNTNDLFFEITIPANQAPGTNYNIKFRCASPPFTMSGTLNLPGGTCSGLTITPSYTPLSPVASSTIGNAQWVAHAFTWTATTGAPLTTPALIAQQNFFSSANYHGHFIKNSLNFDLNYTGSGGSGLMPGAIGLMHDGTSFQCGEGYSTNYSLRFYRNENFTPGFYSFSLGADDGARLSIDGGATWLIDMFTEHSYFTQNTNLNFPTGICLNGPTQLVIEYFQRPVDARVSFSTTLLSTAITQPQSQVICAGNNTTFTVGSNIPSASYQWQVSSDGGISFSSLSASSIYAGVASSTLQINSSPIAFNNFIYNCVITGVCGNAYVSNNASLTVNPVVAFATQPLSQIACVGDTVSFSVSATTTASFQWQINSGSGFVNLSNGGIYANVNNASLLINGVQLNNSNTQFQCIISGCGPSDTSTIALLTFSPPQITEQPQNQEICGTKAITLKTVASNASVYQWQISSDGGLNFSTLNDNSIYQNTSSSELTINVTDSSSKGLFFRCLVGGCGLLILSDTVQIRIQESTATDFAPNVFTPNGDGENDFYELNTAGLSEVKGALFNRWGKEVFKWNSASDKWDGKYKGTTMNEGVYFYTITATSECDGKKIEKHGSLSIFK